MVAKRAKNPTSNSPAGTKASKSLNHTGFAKPKKGAHHGKMDCPIAKGAKSNKY